MVTCSPASGTLGGTAGAACRVPQGYRVPQDCPPCLVQLWSLTGRHLKFEQTQLNIRHFLLINTTTSGQDNMLSFAKLAVKRVRTHVDYSELQWAYPTSNSNIQLPPNTTLSNTHKSHLRNIYIPNTMGWSCLLSSWSFLSASDTASLFTLEKQRFNALHDRSERKDNFFSLR